ncbi:uncharacterized protein LOC21410848 isoform X2 [Morus notabilis]|nr:uncharacterized protein LOC21410848 isoform X2 [Morus notabilis]
MEQLDEMFQTFQGAPRERRDPEAHRTNALMDFMKSKPPMFEGSSDHATAERWLKEIKEKFDTLVVPQEYRVGFATYLFEGSVEDWWDLHMNGDDMSNLLWDEFETLFRDKYIPGTYSGKLVQGDMTVAQYHSQFVELSDCDPTAVADPILKCMKFKEGLRAKIRSQLDPLPLTDFSLLLAAALLAEADFIKNFGGNNGSLGHSKESGKKDKLQIHNKKMSNKDHLHVRNKKISKKNQVLVCHKKTGRKYHSQVGNKKMGKKDQSQVPNKKMGKENQLQVRNQKISKKDQSSNKKMSKKDQLQVCSNDPSACYICQQTGHMRRNCPLNQQKSLLSSGGQQRSQFSSASVVTHNCQTQSALDPNSSGGGKNQIHGQCSQGSGANETGGSSGQLSVCHYCRQIGHIKQNCQVLKQQSSVAYGGQQKSQFDSASSGAHNSQTQLVPDQNLSGGEKNQLQGQSSQDNDTNESREVRPKCRHCKLRGHIKRNCPDWKQESPLASGGQQKSQFDSASSGAHNSQTQPAPDLNPSVCEKNQLQGQSFQGSDSNESKEANLKCNHCRKIGHRKGNCCPDWKQQSPLGSAGQQKNQFDSASLGAHNSQTQPPDLNPSGGEKNQLQGQSSQGSDINESKEAGLMCHHCRLLGHIKWNCPYRKQQSLVASGEQHKSQFDSATSAAHNSQTQPALDPNSSGGEKNQLQGQSSQGSDINESKEAGLMCHYCRLIGHIKQNCPDWKQQSLVASGGQHKSQFDSSTLAAHNSQTQPALDPNSSGGEKNQLQGQSSQGSDTNESKEAGLICHYCRQIGHIKRNCPDWKQQSLFSSWGQHKSQFDSASSGAQNSQTQPAPYNNSSSFGSTSQPLGILLQYYSQMQPQVLGFQQTENALLSHNSQTPPAPYNNSSSASLTSTSQPLGTLLQYSSQMQPHVSGFQRIENALLSHNSQTQAAPYEKSSASFASTQQSFGILPQYYPQMQPRVPGFQQSENAHSSPQASGSFCPPSAGANNSLTQLAPFRNPSVGKQEWLQGPNSHGRGTGGSNGSSGRMRLQPTTCHICHQIGHLKRNCPYGQQQSPLASEGQQRSEFGLADSFDFLNF